MDDYYKKLGGEDVPDMRHISSDGKYAPGRSCQQALPEITGFMHCEVQYRLTQFGIPPRP